MFISNIVECVYSTGLTGAANYLEDKKYGDSLVESTNNVLSYTNMLKEKNSKLEFIMNECRNTLEALVKYEDDSKMLDHNFNNLIKCVKGDDVKYITKFKKLYNNATTAKKIDVVIALLYFIQKGDMKGAWKFVK